MITSNITTEKRTKHKAKIFFLKSLSFQLNNTLTPEQLVLNRIVLYLHQDIELHGFSWEIILYNKHTESCSGEQSDPSNYNDTAASGLMSSIQPRFLYLYISTYSQNEPSKTHFYLTL